MAIRMGPRLWMASTPSNRRCGQCIGYTEKNLNSRVWFMPARGMSILPRCGPGRSSGWNGSGKFREQSIQQNLLDSMSLVRRVDQPAQKQEATGTGGADEEDEGMIGTEDRRRCFGLTDALTFSYYHCGDGSFRALLIDLSPGFMGYV